MLVRGRARAWRLELTTSGGHPYGDVVSGEFDITRIVPTTTTVPPDTETLSTTLLEIIPSEVAEVPAVDAGPRLVVTLTPVGHV